MKLSISLLAVATLCLGFPISELDVSNSTFEQLSNNSLPQSTRDDLATSQLLPHLRIFFNKSAHAIEVTTTDFSITESMGSQTVDSSCSHKITAKNPKGTVSVLNDTKMEFGLSGITWKTVSVFADARLDAKLDISSDIKVELGKHVFGHHCTHLGHKTVGVDVLSHGVLGLGLNFTASNAHIEKVTNGTGYELVFNFECDSVGLVLTWDVEEVTASNCKLKILGIDILSYCGFLEKEIKSGVNNLSAKAIKVNAPKIATKVESALNTLIGGTVRIPLKF